jgi:hypothetical protein
VGEALGAGGCGARWRGHAGRRRQQSRWERRWEDEAGVLTDGGAARGVAGSNARRRERRGV